MIALLVVPAVVLVLLWRRRARQRSLSGTSATAPVFSVEAIGGLVRRKSKEVL